MANFIFTIDTTITGSTLCSTNTDQFQLPLQDFGTYNFEVFWGDGNSDVITTYSAATALHTYTSGGTYEVQISGTCNGFSFFGECDRNKLIEISQWGGLPIGNNSQHVNLFTNCDSLTGITATDAPVFGFYGGRFPFNSCNNLKYVNTDTWDFSPLGTDVNGIFSGCLNLETITNTQNWNFSGATYIVSIFSGCRKLTSIDVTGWDVSNAVTLGAIFSNCDSLTGITGLDTWDTTAATGSLGFMFNGCRSLETITGITNFVGSTNTNIGIMFEGSTGLTTLDLSGWDVSNVISLNKLFKNCNSLTTITGIGDWTLSAATDITEIFLDVPLDVVTYNSILDVNTGWVSRGVVSGLTLTANLSQYCSDDAEAGRTELINTYGWTIDDDGEFCCSDLTAPSGATVENDFENDRIVFYWTDLNTTEDFYRVQRSTDGGSTWTTVANNPPNIYWYYDTDVTFGAGNEYCYRVAAGKFLTEVEGDPVCLGDWSTTQCATYYVSPFCELENPYFISASTCGNNDGEILINNYTGYTTFYSFTLTDSFGNSYTENAAGAFTGLSAGYYFLTATPITNQLRDTCSFEWILIEDSNTDIAVTGSTFTDAVCGSFDQRTGRAVLDLSGATEPYDYWVWNSKLQIVESGSTSNPLVINNIIGGNYYLIIDDGTCRLLYQFTIKSINNLSVAGIKEIYVAQWSGSTDWNYWATSNDPDYYGGLDTLKFQSTKISGYTNAGTWYEIPVDPANVSFNQTLEKVRQGFIFSDTLSIAIPYHNSSKYDNLTSILTKKWIVVFKDNNDQYWTFGYRHGADATAYTFGSEDAGFRLTFSAVSENKIITALNEQYVIDYIL